MTLIISETSHCSPQLNILLQLGNQKATLPTLSNDTTDSGDHLKLTISKELKTFNKLVNWNSKLKMLVEQNTTATSLTPASTPTGTHPTDLSPRSSSSGSNSSTPTPIKEEHSGDNFSALQKLQYTFERDSYFSNIINNNEHKSNIHGKTNISSISPSSRLHERNASPEEALDRIEMNQKFISTPTASPNGISNSTNIFQCPLCAVVCNSRHQFNEHLVTHSKQHACPKCSFIANSDEKLKSHLQEAHDVNDSEFLTDDEIRVPKINSQGKVKTFKCKQCDYKSVTKMEFWAHSKSHIRQEKMLTCPHCPFVTEYKHHLEYHLRNHVGSKPFQCTKCSYTCVNKSMLNSHLKSHSNVYQYRCADCSYATKYCHSLKLHLRKYSHNPSIVLNPDGTPNPLPIIDVYGTRRGPKMKRSADQTPPNNINDIQNFKFSSPDCNSDDSSAEDHSDKTDKSGYNNNCSSVSPVSPEISLLGVKRENGCSTPPFKTFSSEASDSDSEKKVGRSYQHKMQVPEFPLTPNCLTGFMHQSPLSAPLMELASQSSIEAYTAALNQFLFSPLVRMQQQQQQPGSEMNKIPEDQHAKLLSQFLQSQSIVPMAKQSPMLHHSHHLHNIYNNHSSNKLDTPLDLRNPKVTMEDDSEQRSKDDCKKRKPRKGKALRYDRKAESYEEDDNEDSYEVLDFSNNNNNNILGKMETKTSEMNLQNSINGYGQFQEQQSLMTCKYCEISFTHRVLYNMHMNYHSGDTNPFLCKSCGKKTPDKIAFSLHLTTDSH